MFDLRSLYQKIETNQPMYTFLMMERKGITVFYIKYMKGLPLSAKLACEYMDRGMDLGGRGRGSRAGGGGVFRC